MLLIAPAGGSRDNSAATVNALSRIAARWLLTVALLLFLAPGGACWGQKVSNWRVYKMADGLPESACIAVTISPHGQVLARHFNQPFVTELDGYTLQTIPAPEWGKSRVYESPGGQLWSVGPEGLQEFKQGAWLFHRMPEIASGPVASAARVIDPVPLCPLRQGLVICLLPDSLLEFNVGDPAHPRTTVLRTAGQTQLERFSGLTVARDGGLWIAGAQGLAKVPAPLRALKGETPWHEYPLPASVPAHNLQAPHENPEGVVTTLAESTTNQQRMVVCLEANLQRWTVVAAEGERLRQAWRGPDHTTWGITTLALIQAAPEQGEWRENEEISARQYFDVATEPGGAFWLATSDGLFRYAPLLWRSPGVVGAPNSPVQCLAADTEGRLWFASGGRVFALQDERLWSYPFPAVANRHLQARALFPLRNGSIVLEAEDTESGGENQLFRLDPGREAFSPLRLGEADQRFKALGFLKDGSLCLQRLGTARAEPGSSLEKFDGRSLEPIPSPPPLGPTLHTLFTAQNGDLWLSGESGTACCHENKWQGFVSADQTTPAAAIGFTELADGRIWCADSDQIWEFDGRNWSAVRRGFDRINALVRTQDGSVWVASNDGLHRFFEGAWIENGAEEGIPGVGVRALCEDPRGHLWAGTTHGLSLYDPKADLDPPRTFIEAYPADSRSLPQNATLTLTFNGRDKWKYTPPERLLYSYRLDDNDWSPFQELRQVSLSDLRAGPHYLLVRAMDRNGNIERPKPARFDFAIVLPWYRETRLVLSSLAGLAVALFFAALAFNRHLQLLRSYAEVEKKVAERTQQLELASRALLHSQKMNALGALAAGIAHDFNNILSIIKGSAQLIEDNLDNPEKIRIRTDRIKTVVEQGTGIVKAMLGFSREPDQQPAPCDVNAVVDNTLKLLGDRFLHEVQVAFQPAAGLPPVLVSKAFVQQILLNFIFNAAESMSKNKQILLRTSLRTGALETPPADVVLEPDHAPPYIAVSVQDFGCGIPPQNLPRIFEPFFTTKALSTRRGTGLGLSMVYELAKKMGAGLAVQSAVNEGSTFTLILPVRQEATEAGSRP